MYGKVTPDAEGYVAVGVFVDHGFTGAEDLEGVIVSPSPSELADRIAEALGV